LISLQVDLFAIESDALFQKERFLTFIAAGARQGNATL
jgi:hypothetical protein